MQKLKEDIDTRTLAESVGTYRAKHVSAVVSPSESVDISPDAKTVLVGYASEPKTFEEGQLPSREALLYMTYTEKENNGTKEILWSNTAFKLEIRDYNLGAAATKNKAADYRKRLQATQTSKVKALITTYDFDSEGVHTGGTGKDAVTDILPLPKPLSQKVIPLKQLDANGVEKYKIWVSLKSDHYADKRAIMFFNRRPIEAEENVFALSIQGRYLTRPKSYAVSQNDTLHHAFPEQKEFIACSDPFYIANEIRPVSSRLR